MRWALGIAYDGRAYAGWQHQGHARTVQEVLETALGRVADHAVAVTAAGRTDAGVHASGQVVHFDSTAARDARAWLLGSNSNLPDDVSVTWVREVPGTFHARFGARARTYRYLILNTPAPSALASGRATWIHTPLDAAAMHAAAQALVGEHDFSAFRAGACQARSPVRTLSTISVRRLGPWLDVEVTANAFLHHMVRNIVGALLEVGRGTRPVTGLATLLAARDRRQGGATAPPDGLYLTSVAYPGEYDLPASPLPLGLHPLADASPAP